MEHAQESLNEVSDKAELLKRIITKRNIGVYGYDIETNCKAQWFQWRHLKSTRSKKA